MTSWNMEVGSTVPPGVILLDTDQKFGWSGLELLETKYFFGGVTGHYCVSPALKSPHKIVHISYLSQNFYITSFKKAF